MLVNSRFYNELTPKHVFGCTAPCRDIRRRSSPSCRVSQLQVDTASNSVKRTFTIRCKHLLLAAFLAPMHLLTQSPDQFPAVAAAPAPVAATSVAGQNVGLLKDSEIDKKRKKAGVKRAYDGHVAILNKYTKTWVDIKCDFQVPGLLLLREADGQVYWLGYGAVKQVDLSDDMVVQAIAADDWENSLTPVQGANDDGEMEPLVLPRDVFYQIVSLVDDKEWSNPSMTNPAKAEQKAVSKRQK